MFLKALLKALCWVLIFIIRIRFPPGTSLAMRWKAHFFLKGDKISDQNNPFGLPSNKTPPTILEMKSFENDVINLIENIKFRNAENQF